MGFVGTEEKDGGYSNCLECFRKSKGCRRCRQRWMALELGAGIADMLKEKGWKMYFA